MNKQAYVIPMHLRQATPCQQQQGSPEDDAAAAAAAKAAAEKAAADKAAADKAAEDAKNKPTDAEAKLLKEVMQTKEKLTAAQKAADEASTRLKEFEGIDPKQIKELLAQKATADAAAKKAEEDALAAKGEWETLKARMVEAHGNDTKSLKDTIAAKEQELSTKDAIIANLTVGQQFGSSKYIADELTLTPTKARTIYGSYFDVDAAGKVTPFDKPRGEAGRAPIVDASGNAVAFEDAIRKIVEADPEADFIVKSKSKAGAGSDSDKGKKSPVKNEELSSLAKIAAGIKGAKLG